MPVLLKFYVDYVDRRGDHDVTFVWSRTAAEALEIARAKPGVRGGAWYVVDPLPGAIMFPGGACHLLRDAAEKREALGFMTELMAARGDVCLATPGCAS